MRYAVRLLRKWPGFSLLAILALAIGVGANITIFGFVNAVLLRPLDVADPDRLIRGYPNRDDLVAMVPYEDYREYRDRNYSLSSLAMFHWGGLHRVRIGDSLEMIHAMPVTGNYFETLGITAQMGRTIAPRDDALNAVGVVMLSDECWQRHFGGKRDVLGQTVLINEIPMVIIGVAPASFRGTIGAPVVPQFYMSWRSPQGQWQGGHLIGRLKPGISRGQAQADLSRVAAQLSVEQHRNVSISVFPAHTLSPMGSTNAAWFAALFMIVVGTVLLIACDNIAMLLMSRSAARRREFAVRLAIGASRGQLLRQLLTECLVLSILGGIGAAAIAWATSRMLTQIYFPVPMPIALPFVFDARVTAFSVVCSLAATLLFGLGPALQSMKTDVVTALKQAGTGDRSRVRAGLVIVQVSLSTALLVVAAVLVRSAMAPGTAARGFSTSHVLMAVVNLTGYTPERGTAFYRHLQERLDADTGVIASNVLDVIPIAMNRPVMPVELRADNGTATANSDVERVYINNVSPGHFRTLQIPVLHGRDFTVADDAHSKPVCVINQTLAQRFWHGENPVGSHVQTAGGPWIEVIGVARDSKYLSLDEPPRAFLYRPLAQQYASTATILIKASGDLEAAAASLRREISVLEPNLLAYSVQPLEDRIALTLLPNRAAATLAGILGLVGLILGLIGTYGTMSFIVQQRRREIGVRMALGATPGNVVALITRQGMKWTGTGLFAGSAAALAACLLLRRLMFGIVPADPISFLGITSLLAATAYIACYVPARRASHTDPLAALREE